MDDAQKQFYMAQDGPLNLVGTYLGMINRVNTSGGVQSYMSYVVKIHSCRQCKVALVVVG